LQNLQKTIDLLISFYCFFDQMLGTSISDFAFSFSSLPQNTCWMLISLYRGYNCRWPWSEKVVVEALYGEIHKALSRSLRLSWQLNGLDERLNQDLA